MTDDNPKIEDVYDNATDEERKRAFAAAARAAVKASEENDD